MEQKAKICQHVNLSILLRHRQGDAGPSVASCLAPTRPTRPTPPVFLPFPAGLLRQPVDMSILFVSPFLVILSTPERVIARISSTRSCSVQSRLPQAARRSLRAIKTTVFLLQRSSSGGDGAATAAAAATYRAVQAPLGSAAITYSPGGTCSNTYCPDLSVVAAHQAPAAAAGGAVQARSAGRGAGAFGRSSNGRSASLGGTGSHELTQNQ
jgi:hypothetical protein